MSAFAGILRLDGASVERNELALMESAILNHGPDQMGIWIDDSIGVVHRLMRITPEDAFEQLPIVQNNTVVVWNGRLDNRDDIAKKLSLSDVTELADSRVFLAAWQHWGDACVDHMEGDYTFAAWDKQKKRLFAATDAMGARALFYYYRYPLLLFATSPLSLLAHPKVPRRLNPKTLAAYLSIRRTFENETYFQDVERVPPAHTLTIEKDKLRLQCYWQVPQSEMIRYNRDEDYVNAFLEIFQSCVECRLRSAHPIGILLSGGLDSSSVAWIAASLLRQRSQRLQSYTAVPPRHFTGAAMKGRYNDETALVKSLIQHLDNIDPHFICDEGATPLDHLSRWFENIGVPLHPTMNRTWLEKILFEARSNGVRVMLNGQAGNITMSWGGNERLSLLAQEGKWLVLRQEIYDWAKARNISPWRLLLTKMILPMLLPTSSYQSIKSIFRKTSKRCSPLSETARERFVFHRRQLTPENQRLLSLRSYSESFFTGLQAMTGIESRDPTLDRRLAAFCLALPLDQFFKQGVNRRLIKQAMIGKLPAVLLENPLKGIQAPDWYERLTLLRPILSERFERIAKDPIARELIDLPLIQESLMHWPEENWICPDIVRRYNGALGRGLMAGEFACWFHARFKGDSDMEITNET